MIFDKIRYWFMPEQQKNVVTKHSAGALPVLFLSVIAGFAGIVLFAIQSENNSVGIASVGLMVAASSLVIGGLIGFLFGIPRTQDCDYSVTTKKAENTQDNRERGSDFRPNTNLEQISDWLTKILVGVGLTQLSQISQELDNAANTIQSGLGGTPQHHVLALAILTYYPVCGFLAGYLWTRLYLPCELTKSERERIRDMEIKEAQECAMYTFSQTIGDITFKTPQKKTGLWVDDNPTNNVMLKQSVENLLGLEFDLSLSTEDALRKLQSNKKYDVIISDMGRHPDRQAGYTLLSKIKELKIDTPPYIIYAAGAGIPQNKEKAKNLGAFDSTNSPQELLQLVKEALVVGH